MPPQPVSSTPQAPHPLALGPHRRLIDPRSGFVLTIITLVVLVTAAFQLSAPEVPQSVTVLVRSLDGARSLETVSIPSGTTATRSDTDPSTITTLSARTFRLDSGATIMLDDAGVIEKRGGAMRVLIASPVPPLQNTPLAVWGDGAQIAWISPADASLQVFVRNDRGAYAPVFLDRDRIVNSIGFTPDGNALVAAKLGDGTTDLLLIPLEGVAPTTITTLNGLASVIPTL